MRPCFGKAAGIDILDSREIWGLRVTTMARRRKKRMVTEEFSIEAKQDSSWTLPFTIIGVTLLLSFGFLYYYFGPTLSELTGDTQDPSASDELIRMTIGDVNFQVPTSYTRFPRARRGGERESVSLYALLPNLESFSAEKRDIFEANNPDSPVIYFDVAVHRSTLEEADRLNRVYLDNVDGAGRVGPYGLTAYEFSEASGYKDEDLFVYNESGAVPVVIRCFCETEVIPSPHCRRDMRLTETLSLSYRFKRPWLAQWRDINDKVQEFVLSLSLPTAS